MIRLRIKEVAEARGFNMSSLSRRSDISFSTIKRMWRDPYKSVGTEMLGKIACALGVSVHDLIEEVPDTPSEKT
jgi:DNA-binding Xre family transcriptional regulator